MFGRRYKKENQQLKQDLKRLRECNRHLSELAKPAPFSRFCSYANATMQILNCDSCEWKNSCFGRAKYEELKDKARKYDYLKEHYGVEVEEL